LIFTSLAAGLWPALSFSAVAAADRCARANATGMVRGQKRLRVAVVTVQIALMLVGASRLPLRLKA